LFSFSSVAFLCVPLCPLWFKLSLPITKVPMINNISELRIQHGVG